MKRFLALTLCVLFVLSLASCGKSTDDEETKDSEKYETTARPGFEDVTAPAETETTAPDTEETTEALGMTSEKAVELARAYLGEADGETGYKYAYSFDEMLDDNGNEYYKVRVSWYIAEEERYALCGYLLVDNDGNVSEYDW